MKHTLGRILLGCAVAVPGAQAMADTGSLTEFRPHVLPVLVRVDRAGKVTRVSSAWPLSPALDRLLRTDLDRMITRPAQRHGKPVASQFVINLALNAQPRTDGAYDARFTYVSTSPVPSGIWHWAHIDGHRLVLVPDGAFHRTPHYWHSAPPRYAPPPRTYRYAAARPQTAHRAAAPRPPRGK